MALCFFARGLELPNPRRRVIREERDETRRLARSFRTIRARLALASPLARPGSCESDRFRRLPQPRRCRLNGPHPRGDPEATEGASVAADWVQKHPRFCAAAAPPPYAAHGCSERPACGLNMATATLMRAVLLMSRDQAQHHQRWHAAAWGLGVSSRAYSARRWSRLCLQDECCIEAARG